VFWLGLYMTTLYPVICRWYTFLYAGPIYSYMLVLHTLKCQSFILQYVHAIYCYMPIARKTRQKSIIQVNWYFSSVVVSSWKGLYFIYVCFYYTIAWKTSWKRLMYVFSIAMHILICHCCPVPDHAKTCIGYISAGPGQHPVGRGGDRFAPGSSWELENTGPFFWTEID
jgi:hypothetical protein